MAVVIVASNAGNDRHVEESEHTDGSEAARVVTEPSMLDYEVVGADGNSLGLVAADLRAAYPRNRLIIEHGSWLWRHRYVVARSHVCDVDVAARRLRLDLDRAGFLSMPRW